MPDTPILYLASQSPRRMELLRQIGLQPQVLRVMVDETPAFAESPADYVRRLAVAKAQQGYNALPTQREAAVLGSDTAVVLGDRLLGKPRDRAHALEMLAALSGTTHRVLTGVALVGSELGYRLSESQVRFRCIDAAQAAAYWHTGEPADKAGGYAIQGLGGIFVRDLQGSYSGVMGLPLFETAELLTAAGFQLLRTGPGPE